MDINAISQLSNLGNINGVNNANTSSNNTSGASFENMLKDAIVGVNTDQVKGYDAMSDIATGKVTNLQEAVQRIEEAELSLKLALEVKNKAIASFKEVMKMQV